MIARYFDNFLNDFDTPFEDFSQFPIMKMPEMRMPKADLIENASNYQLLVQLPGYKKDEVNVTISKRGVVAVKAEHHERNESKGDYLMKESSSSSYERSFRLPRGIDSKHADVTMENGILNVMIPKIEKDDDSICHLTVH